MGRPKKDKLAEQDEMLDQEMNGDSGAPDEVKKVRRVEWRLDDTGEVQEYVEKAKEKFATEFAHIIPEMIEYCFFSKENSKVKAKIGPIKGKYAMYVKNKNYSLEVHEETWEIYSEEERLYLIAHELMHIHEEGFFEGMPGCKKTLPHDLEDFKSLVHEYGVYKENIKKIIEE